MRELQKSKSRQAAAVARPRTQYLVFTVSHVELAIALERISEIVSYEHVTALPGTPPLARGVVYVRGRMVPVMDAAARLGLPVLPPSKRSCIIMIDSVQAAQRRTFGLAVDRVASLLDVEPSNIQPPPEFGASVDVRYIQGLYHLDNHVLPLVDIEAMFSREDLSAALQHAAGAA